MTPELLLLGLGLLGASGASGWWWIRRASRDHIIRTRTAWIRAGTIIRWGPEGVLCLGHTPRDHASAGTVGALGLTDRALVFTGWRVRHQDRSILLESIRQIMVGRVHYGRGPIARARSIVRVLHQDSEGGWHESAFVVDDPVALAGALTEHCDAPLHDDPDTPGSFGPAPATRLELTAEGDWLTVRASDLYLVPGRLIFHWSECWSLDQIAYLDVLGAGQHILRLETHAGDVTGFELDDPGAWAEAIHTQSDIPIARHDV